MRSIWIIGSLSAWCCVACDELTRVFDGAGGASDSASQSSSSGDGASSSTSSGIGGSAGSSSASSTSSSSGMVACDPGCAVGFHCENDTCVANDACCQTGKNVGVGDNSSPPMTDNYIAWPFLATCDINVDQVQFFTLGGTWWIASDDNGYVGPIVIGGDLPTTAAPEWIGSQNGPVIHLVDGTAYWIIQGAMPQPAITPASVAQNGTPSPFRHSASLAGPWTIGDQWMRFAVNFVGDCP